MSASIGGAAESSRSKPRLAYIVTEDWFFVTHFLPVARAAREAGFEITVVTNVTDHRRAIEAENFHLVELPANRGSFSPLVLMRTVLRLRGIMASERPDVIHAIALKAVILVGLAALFFKEPARLFSFAGLGYLWTGFGWPKRAARTVVRLLTSLFAFNGASVFTFENEDDRREFPSLKRATVIGGWGVETDELRPRRFERHDVLRVAFLGRMLKAKGIQDTVEAVRLARSQGCNVELDLWGKPDPDNPTSHSVEELEGFAKIAGTKWHGAASDVRAVWGQADVAILLSDREGLPRSLIEAAASGLPMIAADVPGCRAIVRKGIDGLLVPCNKPAAAAEAIVRLAGDAELRERMGRAARLGFERRFSAAVVVPKVLDLYLRLAQLSLYNSSPPLERQSKGRNERI
jgi:glycosyltransferase involved in cell wall biosynthesis